MRSPIHDEEELGGVDEGLRTAGDLVEAGLMQAEVVDRQCKRRKATKEGKAQVSATGGSGAPTPPVDLRPSEHDHRVHRTGPLISPELSAGDRPNAKRRTSRRR
jgi:hypothetical protein